MGRRGRWLFSEVDEEVNLYRSGGVEGTEAPDRLLAARRLLEMAKLERVLGLLSRKELLELLAKKLGVPEAEQQQMRNEIERA